MTENFVQSRWSLNDLLEAPSGAPLEEALARVEKFTAAFEGARAKLSADISEADFIDLVKEYEGVYREVTKVAAHAELWFTENTQNQAALSFKSKMEQLAADVENRVLFFTLWWKSLDDAASERLLKSSGEYRYFLESQRRFKPHTLSEAEEKVINLKDVNGVDGLVTIYDMITNKYVFKLEVEGETKELTHGELTTFYRHPSPQVRAATYREQFRVYSQDGSVLAQIYSNRVNDWRAEQVQLRHFATPIASRNLGNDIPDEATETLLKVCRENAPLFQRYFRLKARWLGLNPMRRSDIYAPVAQPDINIPFSEGTNLVLDSLAKFSPRVAAEARSVFSQNHIDSEVRPGKRGGAFCASTLPELAPWVLINYTNKPRDVSTLAHELGHAIHSQLAKDHSLLTFHPVLPMAETASVFSEMILNERLLENETEPMVRRDLLARLIDDAYATVMRQAYFVMFEKQAYPAIEQGKTLDELNAMYLENLHEQFGDAVEVADEFKWEWIVIPHFFHTPFYTYAYSFGQLLTLSLYRRYREEGQAFIPKYLRILSYGGSASPSQILGEAGIDITSSEFWQGGFNVIRDFIDQLQALEPVPA